MQVAILHPEVSLEPKVPCGISVYRNSIDIKHVNALQKIYPAVYKLVGADFFTMLSYDYQMQHPATHWSLSEFGRHLADFLSDYPKTVFLSYLPDMARLEWARHEVLFAPDSASFDVHQLQAIPESDYPQLYCKLHAAIRLLSFTSPILDIWHFCYHNNSGDELFELKPQGNVVLLSRKDFEVDMQKITLGEYTLLSQLNQGDALGEAIEQALLVEPQLQVESLLSRALLEGWFSSVS
jgi:hypothetical protein